MDISYIELPALDFDKMIEFYRQAFDWTFEDCGFQYVGFSNSGIQGGFSKIYEAPPRGGPIIMLESKDIAATEEVMRKLGTEIVGHFEFPGGTRFHFIDPTGNELAVWTKAPRDPKS